VGSAEDESASLPEKYIDSEASSILAKQGEGGEEFLRSAALHRSSEVSASLLLSPLEFRRERNFLSFLAAFSPMGLTFGITA